MTLFKKDLHQSTLYEKVEQRISNMITLQTNHLRQKSHRIFSRLVIPLSLMTFTSAIWFLLTPSAQSKDLIPFIFLLISVFLFAVIGSSYLDTLINLKKMVDVSQYNFFISGVAIKPDNEFIINEHLNEDEINELFSLPLEENQIAFLQQKIITNNYISLTDLSQLMTLKDEEEKNSEKEKQHKLHQFFVENNLSQHPHAQLIKNNLNHHETEHNLASLL